MTGQKMEMTFCKPQGFTFNFLSDAEKWIRAYCENPGNAVLEHLLARFRGGALPKGYCNLYT